MNQSMTVKSGFQKTNPTEFGVEDEPAVWYFWKSLPAVG